jgi:hypothetical protein
MKKLRKIVTVAALACTFIFAIGIFTVGAVEVCWEDPDEPDDLIRLDFLLITGNNWLVNGFAGPMFGDARMIFTGNGRVVGTNFIIHLSGSGPRPGEPRYEIFNGTMVVDLLTGDTTVEGINLVGAREPPNGYMEYLGSWSIIPVLCP